MSSFSGMSSLFSLPPKCLCNEHWQADALLARRQLKLAVDQRKWTGRLSLWTWQWKTCKLPGKQEMRRRWERRRRRCRRRRRRCRRRRRRWRKRRRRWRTIQEEEPLRPTHRHVACCARSKLKGWVFFAQSYAVSIWFGAGPTRKKNSRGDELLTSSKMCWLEVFLPKCTPNIAQWFNCSL